MFKLLFLSSVSACFELTNDEIYYSAKKYNVILNGKKKKVYDTNVFSLFNLTPDTEYTVGTTLDDFTLSFKTKKDSVALSVKDFGAVGDGTTDDTQAIQSAIDVCSAFGRVIVPEGVYFVKPLLLKSDITLELDKKCKLLFSTDPKDFPVLPGEVTNQNDGGNYQISSWEGGPDKCYRSCLSAYKAHNFAIVGEGTVDGNAQNGGWWINPKDIPYGRPRLFFTNDCDDVTLHGITVCNSPSWTTHPFFTRNFNLLDARINAPKDSPNTDGCNPESCDGVNIIGTIFSVGDDCIAIKSGKLYMGAKYKRAANNHTIRNCLMRYGHGAVVLGSEMSGGINNLSVNRCLFDHTDRGLRIKTRRGRGKDGIIDNVLFENIKMKSVLTPLVINMYYFCDPDGKTEYVWSKQPYPLGDDTPYLGAFTFRDIYCSDCEVAAGFFYGLPEQPIKSVTIENMHFHFNEKAQEGKPAMMSFMSSMARTGLYFNNVDKVNLNNVIFEKVLGDEVICVNVPKVVKENVRKY